MDLKDFKAADKTETGAVLALTHPVTGQPIANDDDSPWEISLRGPDSKAYQKRLHQLQDKRMNGVMSAKGMKPKISAADMESDALELLVIATVGWSGIVEDGVPMEFNADNVLRLYRDFPWIREQADAFLKERANFLGN